MALTPYSGPWTQRTAAHLMRRACFGPKKSEIDSALSLGLSGALDKLFETPPTLDPPINYMDRADTNAPIGSTWVAAPHTGENASRTARWRSLTAWQLKSVYERRFNIEQRMFLFWHNHFPVDFVTVRDPRHLYTYWATLGRNLLGNFKTMVEEITIDPAILGTSMEEQIRHESRMKTMLVNC